MAASGSRVSRRPGEQAEGCWLPERRGGVVLPGWPQCSPRGPPLLPCRQDSAEILRGPSETPRLSLQWRRPASRSHGAPPRAGTLCPRLPHGASKRAWGNLVYHARRFSAWGVQTGAQGIHMLWEAWGHSKMLESSGDVFTHRSGGGCCQWGTQLGLSPECIHIRVKVDAGGLCRLMARRPSGESDSYVTTVCVCRGCRTKVPPTRWLGTQQSCLVPSFWRLGVRTQDLGVVGSF